MLCYGFFFSFYYTNIIVAVERRECIMDIIIILIN